MLQAYNVDEFLGYVSHVDIEGTPRQFRKFFALTPEGKLELLTKRHRDDGSNALIRTINQGAYSQWVMKRLVGFVLGLDLASQSKIMEQVDDSGANALLKALSKLSHGQHQDEWKRKAYEDAYLDTVERILAVIKKLPLDSRLRIFHQVDKTGVDVLLYARRHSEASYHLVLNAIQSISVDDGAAVLKQVTENGANALMFAAQYSPIAVAPILGAIQSLSATDQAAVFKQVTKDGANALMLAAQYSPTAIAPILGAIQSLSAADQTAVFEQVNIHDNNALMFAAQYSPETVVQILNAMVPLTLDKRAAILTKSNIFGFNALMCAAAKNPTAVVPLIDAMKALDPAIQAELLKQVDKEGCNALMHAAKHHPTAVPPLIGAMKALDPAIQAELLKQVDKEGCNALMHAAKHHPTAVVPLIDAMKALAPAIQAELLKQVDKEGCNALMHAAKHHPTAVVPLIEAMKALAPAIQAELLKQVDKEGCNALMHAAKHHPTAVIPLIKVIFSCRHFTVDQKYQLIHESLKEEKSPLGKRMQCPEIIYLQCINDMDRLLEHLKPKKEDSGPNSQTVLYKTLKTTLDEYKSSNQSAPDLRKLNNSWSAAITNAKNEGALKGLPHVMDVLKTMLLILSVVGILYLSYQARENSRKNRSMFFPGTTEKIVNTLEDMANTISIVNEDESMPDGSTSSSKP